MKHNTNPISVSMLESRESRILSINKYGLKDMLTPANIFALFFVIVDFVVLYSRWDSVGDDNWYMMALLALGCSAILDVPMVFAAESIVKFNAGLKSKKQMLATLIPSVTGFVLIFSLNMIFSIVTKDSVFKELDSFGLIDNMATSNQIDSGSSPKILIAAIFSGFIPLGTSLLAFVVSIATCNPMQAKTNKILKSKIAAEEHLLLLQQAIAESEKLSDRGKILLVHQKDLYNTFVEEVFAVEGVRKQAYREALEEVCQSLDEVNIVIENSKKANTDFDFSNEPYSETENFINSKLTESKISVLDVDSLPSSILSAL